MRFSIKKLSLRMRLAILSGFLIGTSYIPFPPWALFFSLVPLWVAWFDENSPKKVFFYGWVAQFLLTLIGFHWVAHTSIEYGHMPPALGVLVLVGFCCVAHLHIPLAGWVWSLLKKRIAFSKGQSLLVLVLLTILFERFFPMVFPWHMGYPWLWAGFPAVHWADVFGFETLSAMTIATNGVVFWIWSQRSQRAKLWKSSAVLALAFVALNISGWAWGQRWSDGEKSLKVLVVQANIGNFDKYLAEFRADFRKKILDKYLTLTKRGLDNSDSVDLFVWPETAFPSNLDMPYLNGRLQRRVLDFIHENKTPAFIGGYSENYRTRAYYNGIFLFNKRAVQLGFYRKSILLAFGEYFPGADSIPFLKKMAEKFLPEISHFGRGHGPQAISLDGIKLGGQVCYEGLFPWFSRGLVEKDAQIFFNVTNDSWFGGTFEPYQHLYMTLARAIEFRRPLIRSTNTGISTVILASGKILEQSPWGSEWAQVYDVKYDENPEMTLYSKIQPYLPASYFILLFGTILVAIRRKMRD